MKIRLPLFFVFYCLFFLPLSNAQLSDGAVSPDFDLNDILGVNHQLYSDYLDNNKHVVLDFSATWCGPCWNYHNSGALDGFYDDHGPSGDDVAMVLMLEGRTDTNTNCLYGTAGCNNSTWGNWVAGTPYPIIDAPTNQLKNNFSVGYWPTIYMINGFDNRIFEVGQASASSLSNWLESFDLEVTNTIMTAHDCHNYGSLELETEGGYGNLFYSWSNGATSVVNSNLATGDYYVTISDANGYFIEEGPFTVTPDNSNTDFNITPDFIQDVTCNGVNDGYITVLATGLDLDYTWSNGSNSDTAVNLGPGTHSVVISNYIGCVDSEVFVITEPPLLSGTVIEVDPDCLNNNGEIIISGTGGVPPYNYHLEGVNSFDGVFQNLPSGDYYVAVTDQNLCVYTTLINLIGDPLPVAMTAVPDVLNCINTQVLISGDGSSSGSNFYYEWQNQIGTVIAVTKETMVDSAGIYTLIVTDLNTCSSSTNVEVFEDYSEPDITSSDNVLTCSSSQVEICMDVTNATSYYWDVNGMQIEQLCVMVESAGDYTATAIAANGCGSTAVSTVNIDTDLPVVESVVPEVLTCVLTTQTLTAMIDGITLDHTIIWSTADGNITNTVSALEIEVDAPGVYEVSVTNNATGCNTLTAIVVDEFVNTPEASFTAENDDDYLYLTGFAEGDPSNWEWFVDGVSVGSTQDFSYSLMGEQTALVCLQVQNECGVDEFCNSVSITDPLTITVNSQNIACFGGSTGSIEIDALGGVSPYTFSTVGPNSYTSATQNLSNLPAGTYDITVNDSETRMTQITVIITENPELLLMFDTVEPLCFGSLEGEINLEITGGAGDYSYEWSTGAMTQNLENLTAGSYSVLVTDIEGCTTESSFTLLEPVDIIQEGVVQDVNCNGESSGSIVLSLTGGTGTLDLNWDDDSLDGVTNTNVSVGTYVLNIQDENGCVSEESYTVSEPDAIIQEGLIEDVKCNGESSGSIVINVAGGTGVYSLDWNNDDLNGASNMSVQAGTYVLNIQDENGCMSVETYTVSEPEALDYNIISKEDDIGGNGGSIDVSVSGGVMPYEFDWSNGADTEDLSGLMTGTYTLTVFDDNGCELVTDDFDIAFISDVNEIENLTEFIVYPNPATELINVRLELSSTTLGNIKLFNQNGQLLSTQNFNGEGSYADRIDVSNYSSGIYLLKINTENGIALKKVSILK